jgi:sec-independent protein translocase protein TatB
MDIGWGEILIILIVALLVVGPEKLPAYARKTARFVRKFQRITTNLTGEISRAINLDDDEGGQASDFKKDLIAVKKSLESDVAELKATLDGQAKAISETVESGTKDAAAQIEQNAREISAAINTQAGELKSTLDAQAKTISETVESSAREVSAAVVNSSETANGQVKEPAPNPISAPPPIPAIKAEVS